MPTMIRSVERTPEEIQARMENLNDEGQRALMYLCDMLLDCFTEEPTRSAVIVMQEGPVVGFAMVKADMKDAMELLDGAGTAMKEAVMGDAPPKEMMN